MARRPFVRATWLKAAPQSWLPVSTGARRTVSTLLPLCRGAFDLFRDERHSAAKATRADRSECAAHARVTLRMLNFVDDALGLNAESLGAVQMTLRAVITYFVALAFVRIGDKRFLGKHTAFDVVVGVMFGSVMSRAITTADAFLPVLLAGGVLVGLHFVVALVAFRSDRIGTVVKGQERTLVRDGEIVWSEMATAHLTRRDLDGALRRHGKVEAVEDVKLATLERSGEITVIPRDKST